MMMMMGKYSGRYKMEEHQNLSISLSVIIHPTSSLSSFGLGEGATWRTPTHL